MFEAHSQKSPGTEAQYDHNTEGFMRDMIGFIEEHTNRPSHWPILYPYSYDISC